MCVGLYVSLKRLPIFHQILPKIFSRPSSAENMTESYRNSVHVSSHGYLVIVFRICHWHCSIYVNISGYSGNYYRNLFANVACILYFSYTTMKGKHVQPIS